MPTGTACMGSGAGEGMTAQRSGDTEIALRKEHHLDICLDDQRYPDPAPMGTSLDQVQFLHQALPELDSARVDTTQPFLHATLRLPLMISCMTGGSGRGRSANRALAAAAQRAGVAVGLGSIRPLLQDEATFGDFHVKPLAPDVPVLANLGAVQLRDLHVHTVRRVLQRLEVQALVVHLNAGQELFQPDGDRDFCGLLGAIERVTGECGLPVIVKETGFGIRPGLVRSLLGCGVQYVDLAGADGTNWVTVEGRRLPESRQASAETFAGWGLPTGVLLALLRDVAGSVIASGGLRHGVHLAKAVAMGAACGAMALPFIRAVMADGSDGALALIHRVEHELRTAMTLCGATSLAALRQAPVLQSASFRHQVAELKHADSAFPACHRPTRNAITAAAALRERASDDIAYQTGILPGVSRTFALTIPQLPEQLRQVVCNTYLLCRIADTVEDEPELSAPQKQEFLSRLVRVVTGHQEPESFARELHPLLSSATLPSERDLVANTPRIVRITHQLRPVQRNAVERCVSIMAHGMAEFQHMATLGGLADQAHLDRYCYYVAGVVGETLTELFCDYSDEINQRRDDLFRLSVAFGQGLQMTNILKDVWTDRLVGSCWLPQDIFRSTGFELRSLPSGRSDPRFAAGMLDLVAVASRHLEDALRFTLLIPARETGIRRFCLWALGMAVLSLRRIYAQPDFAEASQVKITRRSVRATMIAGSALAGSDPALRMLFRSLTRKIRRRPGSRNACCLRPGETSAEEVTSDGHAV